MKKLPVAVRYQHREAWREAHRAEKAEYDRRRRAEKKEEIAAKKRADYLAHQAREDTRVRAWGAANKERLLAIKKKYRDNNKEKLKAYSAQRPKRVLTPEQQEQVRVRVKLWARKYPEKVAEQSLLRYRRKLQAKPSWVDPQELHDIYVEARHMQMHVDHIVPLKGKAVSGLHVPWNLQLLPPTENHVKSNRYAD